MFNRIILAIIAFGSSGLGFATPKDLVLFVKEAKTQTLADKIQPLPELRMVKTQAMNTKGMRNPFDTPAKLKVKEAPTQVIDDKQHEPDLARRKTPLEKIPLENLKFSGVIEQNGHFWAIITNVKNQHTNIVQVGDYIGRDYGRVDKITAKYVEIDERKKGKEGQWLKVDTVLKLDQAE
ncbi:MULTISPECIES: pilus assembly protein PilP [Cysteiniphilum]|uniref:pilus assembly protein PilP n=1 Tax=Cysteiniphilum TaxID=2056696 RepID=UPI001780CD2E|nr:MULTISPECIES: pilus assembly protein PilP [Cysteiniphilum]